MHSILIAGNGQIGSVIGELLTQLSQDYRVILADLPQPSHFKSTTHLVHVSINITNQAELKKLIEMYQIEAIVSCLPYFLNLQVAQAALAMNIHYFDLTEDVATSQAIAQLVRNAKKAFVSQCGVAPGFINIVAHHLMQRFDSLETVKLRCGALPNQASNALHYALTWSLDGLINEYGNPCPAIVDGQSTLLSPLTDIEQVQIDGLSYEAFNTSGGLGSLAYTYVNKVKTLNYKTLRYPGHCEKIAFLMFELKLNDNREVLKNILKNALPHTHQDVVLVYVSAEGFKNNELIQENYIKKFYPAQIGKHTFTAIQMTTASSVCGILDLVMEKPEAYLGFIEQTQFDLHDFLSNRFTAYFHNERNL